MKIKVREKLTINNLKSIVAGKMKNSKKNIKITQEDKEITGHKRLIDIGLVDGAKLEAKANKMEDQVEEVKDNRKVKPGEEQ